MLRLSRFCIAHRAPIFAWIALAIAVSLVAQQAGRRYATNFTLPGTQSQQALDLLQHGFAAQSGDVDMIVFHVSSGTVDAPAVRAAMSGVFAKAQRLPHVVSVTSPYGLAGAIEVSANRTTAFATVNYDKRSNLLPNNTGTPLLDLLKTVRVAHLQVAAGGQVIENAEGFNIGPATTVGVVAALVILLVTFGSLIAAGIPLVTAGLGLVTGVGLIGLTTHITAVPMVSTDLALMIGLGVGIDYALFIVTRFRENYTVSQDVPDSVIGAMDTSGRAILLAGSTVVIALLGMFATGVGFMYGLSISSVLAVLLTLAASLTLLPTLLARLGRRISGPALRSRRFARRSSRAAEVTPAPQPGQGWWRRWSKTVQARPWPLALVSLALMVAVLTPVLGLRLDTSDAGNDPANTSTRVAYDLLAQGFGPGVNGPLLLVAELPAPNKTAVLGPLSKALAALPDVSAASPPRVSPQGNIAVVQVYPRSSPQAQATMNLVDELRHTVLPPLSAATKTPLLVGGFTAGSIDFSNVLAGKLPLFIAIVVIVSALVLLVMFRSLLIALQAALMNLLTIGGALGATVAVFQWGWFGSILGVQKGPIEPWIPVLMFAVVFGLSMDYEVFLVSRVREQWLRHGDASEAVADGVAFTGRVITAAAAIMICVFLSFMLGNERILKEFGFGLAAAVFLDALVVRCVLLPAVLELLGASTWRLPVWLDRRIPHINIEGGSVHAPARRPAPVSAASD